MSREELDALAEEVAERLGVDPETVMTEPPSRLSLTIIQVRELMAPSDWHNALDAVQSMLEGMGRSDRNDAIEALRSRFEELYDRDEEEDDEDDLVTPETVRTWTYSRVNSGGTDVTHGFTFTGNAEQWAKHVDEVTHQGIEIYNATTEENA